jgi:exonuclease SbcC
MKICQIKLKNIHSLKGEHTIDFENGALGDAGLFVITGPTGAGKSTILDVITLALFNRIPRISAAISKKVIDEEGVILTKNTNDCYAEVEYLVDGILYRSNWSIRLTRNNTLAERLHEVVDVTNGNTIISSSISQVPKENERIIGLSYEQFVQSMILAQGQFSKLLLAKRDERNTLLEEITGTGYYRTIGKNVFSRFREEENRVKRQSERIDFYNLLSEEDIQLINEKINLEKPLLKEVNEKLISLDSKVKIKESIIKNTQRKVENEELFKKITIEKDEFKSKQIRLEEHSKFSHLRAPWEELKRKQKEQVESSNQLKNSELDAINYNDQLIQLIQSGSELVKEDLDSISFENALDEFQTKVLELQSEEQKHKQNIENESKRIEERISQLNRFGFVFEEPKEVTNEIDIYLKQIEEKIAIEKINSLDDILALRANLNALRLPASQLLGIKRILIDKNEALNKLKNQFTDQQATIESKKVEYKELIETGKELKLTFEVAEREFENSKKVKDLESYRADLQNNCPCPLCGSLEHPFTIDNPYESKTNIHEENYKNVKRLVELNTNSTLVLATEITSLEKSNKVIEGDLKSKQLEIEKENLEVIRLSNDLKWDATITLSDVIQKTEDFENQLIKLNQLEKLLEAKPILIDLKKILETFSELNIIHQSTKNQRISLYPGNDILNLISQLKTKKISIDQQIQSNSKAISTLSESIQHQLISIESESLQLFDKVKALGLIQLEELDVKIISEVEANLLREQFQKINTTETSLKASLETIEKELVENLSKDDTTLTFEQVNALVKTTEEELDVLKKSIWELENQLKLDSEKREKLKEDQLILDALKRDLNVWSKMNALIGDASGKKFSNFVQDLTLKQLIEYGNERLKGFSDRYLLEVENEAENLKVIDTYMGNTQRAVSSLSGGETFKLSLALAFGLSDLAAKNVNIESLFIDEGFGTLDPESLDQAITILENMQNTTNKSIGIISHVGELKDRIGTKIKLVRSGAGYSSIEIE